MIIEAGKEVKVPEDLRENRIIMENDGADLGRSSVVFKGKGNILYLESPLRLGDSKITFGGDNALVYLSANTRHITSVKIDAWRETTVFIGNNNFFGGPLYCVVSERKNLIIGSGGVFSFGIWARTADPHLLYDIDTRKRINPSKSIFVGDHVWLGQNCMLLKGSKIGSGSVIAAGTVLSNKTVESNSVYAGNPAKKIKSNVFFSGESVHNYTAEQTELSMQYSVDEYIYGPGKPFNYEEFDQKLTNALTADERLQFLRNELAGCRSKNLFYVPS